MAFTLDTQKDSLSEVKIAVVNVQQMDIRVGRHRLTAQLENSRIQSQDWKSSKKWFIHGSNFRHEKM